MLIQLVEPGMTPDPHADDVAIGIDFGTTHCVLAIATETTVDILKREDNQSLIPTVITYTDQGYHVGHHDHNSITSIKRLIGRTTLPENLQQKFVDKFIVGSIPLQLRCGSINKSVTAIAADLFISLKKIAEQQLSQAVNQAVITVPAYYDEAARQQTKTAAELAGFKVLRLINEPTAAALAYGLDQQTEGTYAVYDLGGGTFDVSILKFAKGVFQVIATAGDTLLGGDDIDQRIATDLDIAPNSARTLKELLSSQEQATIEVEGHKYTLDQIHLKQLALPLLERSLEICQQALRDAKLSPLDLNGIVLVGGATRMPAVRETVAHFFGKVPLTNLNPDEIVAAGAALQAKALTKGSQTLLLDVTPLSLGLEIMGGIVEKVIHRNTAIPVSMAQEFTTYEDGQTMMKIHILQGEREFVSDCRSLGEFILSGIPAMVAGAARIRVTFSLDADGLLTVTASEQITGVSQTVEVKTDYGLTEEEMLQMLKEGWQYGQDDLGKRLLVETQLDARQLLAMVDHAVAEDSDLLEPLERETILSHSQQLAELITSNDRTLIQSASKRLEKLCQDFAERRMSRSIERALRGQKISEIK